VKIFTPRTPRVLLAFAVGCGLGLSWGVVYHIILAGLMVAPLLGTGLAFLSLASAPSNLDESAADASNQKPRRRAVVLPALLGLFFVAVGLFAIRDPVWFLGPAVLFRSVELPESGEGIRIFSEVPDQKRDDALIEFVGAFHDEFARAFFDPGECSVDVHLIRSKERFEQLQRLGMESVFGAIYESAFWGRQIFLREGRGMGTLTHLLANHYFACAGKDRLHPWFRVAVATQVEKFIALREGDTWQVSFFYRSDWRFPEIARRYDPRHFLARLLMGVDQNLIRVFGLYLRDRGWLRPLLTEAAPFPKAGLKELKRLSGMEYESLALDLDRWLKTEALAIPTVRAAFSATGQDAVRVRTTLEKSHRWDAKAHAWRGPAGQQPAPSIGEIHPPLF
jgi:hypothetical protein